MTVLGAIFLPQFPPESLRGVARAADEAGLDELWLWEDCFLNGGVSAASAALAWTARLRVGIGIMPVPLRNVALCAMEIATLHRMFGDRAVAGVGHGLQVWMEQVGARVASPLTLLREYATALRALLAGESVTIGGRYVRLDAVRLDWPPATAAPLYVGGIGPKTLALAAELGDGTILTAGTSQADVAARRRAVDGSHEIVVFVSAAVGPDAERRLAVGAEQAGQGFPGLAGPAERIAEGVREFAAAGATKVILQPPPDEREPESYVRFVAEGVRPLVD